MKKIRWDFVAGGLGLLFLFGRGREKKKLSSSERTALITQEAQRRGIEPALALAFFEVESGNKGFGEDGKLIIRYEPHIFRRRTKRWLGSEKNVVRKGGSQAAQYEALHAARKIHDRSGLESISMGSSQIMGFNSARIGYPTVQAMWKAFNASEANHIKGFFKFVDTGEALTKAVKSADYSGMARHYNGAGGVAVYGPKIQKAHARWRAKGA